MKGGVSYDAPAEEALPSSSRLSRFCLHFLSSVKYSIPSRFALQIHNSAKMAASSEMPGPGRLEILLNMPAVPPPAGIIPNLDNPPSIDTICYTTFSLCLSLASLAVGIRLYTKSFVIRCIAYEDCEYPKFVFAVHTILMWFSRLVYDWIGKNPLPSQMPMISPLILIGWPLGLIRTLAARSNKWCWSPCVEPTTKRLLSNTLRMINLLDLHQVQR